jgi:Spy/CpxP family protein refolding chaperone
VQNLKIIACLVAIFGAGIVTGSLVTLKVVKTVAEKRNNLDHWATNALKDYQTRLKLTPAQTDKLRPVFDQAATDLRRVRSDTMRDLFGVFRQINDQVSVDLTPEQQKRLEEMRKGFMAKFHPPSVPRPK